MPAALQIHEGLSTTATRGRERHLTVPEPAFNALFLESRGNTRSEGGRTKNKAEGKHSTKAANANMEDTISSSFPSRMQPPREGDRARPSVKILTLAQRGRREYLHWRCSVQVQRPGNYRTDSLRVRRQEEETHTSKKERERGKKGKDGAIIGERGGWIGLKVGRLKALPSHKGIDHYSSIYFGNA